MSALKIPGVAFALVDHGKVVFEGGFGERELGRGQPVDAHTRFMIASNTKGLTTLLLARLVDEGKLSWDEPVTDAYPDFRLGSPETTNRVQIKHLVCACTGLPRNDREWIFNTPRGTPPSATFAKLAQLQKGDNLTSFVTFANPKTHAKMQIMIFKGGTSNTYGIIYSSGTRPGCQ